MRNLIIEMIDHGRVKTTHAKCKAVQPFLERLITLSKSDTVANRRRAFGLVGNKASVKKLFEEVAPRFRERPGGYTRALKASELRLGDGAPVSYLFFVDDGDGKMSSTS